MNKSLDDISIGTIGVFCLVAERNGFTQAAKIAGLTPAAVSRAMSRLEEKLGASLFVRSTRHVRLTESGQRYYQQCRIAMDSLASGELALHGELESLKGRISLSMPTSYGHYRIIPLIAEFQEKNPDVEIVAHIENDNANLIARDFDFVIRSGEAPDSGLIARPLERPELVVVATPRYLQKFGMPQSLDDLEKHQCLSFSLPRTGRIVPWRFRLEGKDVEMSLPGRTHCHGDVLGPVSLARQGAGITQTYFYVVERDLQEGSLKVVLKDYGGRRGLMSVMYPAHRYMPVRVRKFIDFLIEKLLLNKPFIKKESN
nr:LysR substrate-binding domain-containing protein [Pectobacterium colocasium]